MHRPGNSSAWRAALALVLIGLAGLTAAAAAERGPAASAFEAAPSDPRAVTVKAKGDGKADDSQALQAAIDLAAAKPGGGVVFLASGHYRISRSLFIWPSVRLFGVGRTRPVIVLGAATPGFQQGLGTLIVFSGARRGDNARGDVGFAAQVPRVPFPPPTVVPFDARITDANPGTFYSGISNVDIEIGPGNPGATGIRFHAAQHAFLSNMNFRLRSGFAGLYQAGNVVHNLHFHGGRYGIVTEKPSPAWQFTVVDCTFDGQTDAAIREHEASLTLVNVAIRNVPVGLELDRGYGDWLWGKDVRFEQVRQAAIVISNENNIYTQIGFEDALASGTPVFARFRDSGRTIPGKGASYRVRAFSHGLAVPGMGQMGKIATTSDITPLAQLPQRRPEAIRPLPPVAQWANAHDLGVSGDSKADDTAALQRAIDTHRVVYLPQGFYKVSGTIHLRPDSVLIGLHPSLTQIAISDNTPGYQGTGEPKALLQSASGGDAIVSGVGLSTGGINPRAVALLWGAGENSLVDDVKLEGGHGTTLANGETYYPYNASHSGDADPARRWDGQYPSLWVQHGGGTFNGIWSPDTFASAGVYISDTTVPGHLYEVSVEHHVRNEVVLDRVAHWELLALQTEEEYGESRDAVSLEIRDSQDILVANYHGYRVTRTLGPALAAVQLYGARDVRFRNVHVNAESGSASCEGDDCLTFLRANKFPYDNAIADMQSGLTMREREFARLDLPAAPAATAPATAPNSAGATGVQKLAEGFEALGGGVVDSHGALYFVDRNFQRIYGWSQEQGLKVVDSQPLDAVNLAIDASDNLMVLSSAGNEGTVYSMKAYSPGGTLTPIKAVAAGSHPNASIAVPVNWWVNGEFKDQYDASTDSFKTLAELFAGDAAASASREYASPDGSLVLPAYPVIHQGPPDNRGRRFSHALDTYGYVIAKPGSRIFISNESEARTYTATLGPKGALQDLKVFAERGGESVVAAATGRVYLANGQIFVYSPTGSEVGRIDVPERPLQLLIGGPNRSTLLILTHHTLYSADLAQPGS